MKFDTAKVDSKGRSLGWALALMEMLVDPILYTWVPAWVSEQYERANPFFKEVLLAMQSEVHDNNLQLLKRTRKEMIHRHHLHLRRKKNEGDEKKSADDAETESDVADAESEEDVGDDAGGSGLDFGDTIVSQAS